MVLLVLCSLKQVFAVGLGQAAGNEDRLWEKVAQPLTGL